VENLNDLALLGTFSELAEMQPFSPDAMAQAARADAESLLQAKRLSLRTALAADLPMPVGDVARLQRALSNVLQYSARRAPAGGELRLSLSVQPAGMVWIDVQDDGPAVGPEDEAGIFDAYSEAATGGSYTIGMGMAVARRILEAHGGSLTILPSAGSWVRLALPVASPRSP
jgi:signal transduction histidine kinase